MGIERSSGLVGTKYGCGIAQCGACTVHIDGNPVRSCTLPVSAIKSAKVTTIEGLSKNGDHPVQLAWDEVDVPQCGYCQAGQIMTAAALLKRNPKPTQQQIDDACTAIFVVAALIIVFVKQSNQQAKNFNLCQLSIKQTEEIF
jgi:Aerobic-type carbon monoxide dehydrogenase, small subunit CoxS/CutS homologs